MAKIAAELTSMLAKRAMHGAPAELSSRLVAGGEGWLVEDVLCTSGPSDPSFEERHSFFRAAIVGAGAFQCRSTAGLELLSPGSVLLGNAGECFECAHEHGTGDRCVAFSYSASYFERLAVDAGISGRQRFDALRLPPLREVAPLAAQACAGLLQAPTAPGIAWEQLGVELAATAIRLARGVVRGRRPPRNAERRVMRTVRLIDHDPAAELALEELARRAALSPYHFLRTFERLTGVTPHQYVLRARLRLAATRVAVERGKILDIALECGFCDASNFNRAFKAEFGLSPRAHRGRYGRTRRFR